MNKKILITGGSGFIGSAVVRYIINKTNHSVINVDKLTYSGNLDSLASIENNSRYAFEKVDICDQKEIRRIFKNYRPDIILHLAAETHVDRSIDGPTDFIQTNIMGTSVMLECAREYWNNREKKNFLFHHISTDEVYGSLNETDLFTEQSKYDPSSPYSASKASSDHLVRAWHRTYGLPVIITNCSNNYGPYQFPEKLIPLIILRALSNKPLPVYGTGLQIRDWLHVEDHVEALYEVIMRGKIGETYNIGGNNEKTNLEVVYNICDYLDKIRPKKSNAFESYRKLISFTEDRPGHDQRYAIDSKKIKKDLGWKSKVPFKTGLHKTIEWYIDNSKWCKQINDSFFRDQRLGLIDK